jgi:hypothetical protein
MISDFEPACFFNRNNSSFKPYRIKKIMAVDGALSTYIYFSVVVNINYSVNFWKWFCLNAVYYKNNFITKGIEQLKRYFDK